MMTTTHTKPTWIREDGSHDTVAYDTAHGAYKTEALKYTRPIPPLKGGHIETPHNYQPHPDGPARERWHKSGSLLSFPEWCLEQGLAER